jgi:acyl-CoA thioesterase-1
MKAARRLCGVSLALVTCAAGAAGGPARAASALVERLDAGEHQTIVVYGTSLTAGGAWVSQLSSSLNTIYPGQITWVNAGLSGKASNSGVANLANLVLTQNPDAVFIEFAMNDAFTVYPSGDIDYGITLQQSQSNLGAMIDDLRQQNPEVEIVLQTMNPAWDAPNGNQSGTKRPQLELYYQAYRDVAETSDVTLIDNFSVWQRLLANMPTVFQSYVSDGTHPNAAGYARIVTPSIQWTLGGEMGLALLIDPDTGRGVLKNRSSDDLQVISYSIASPSGALLTSWNSLGGRGNDSWFAANATARVLSELNPLGVQAVPAGSSIDLGDVWNSTKALDIDFTYQTPDGVAHVGSVVYTADAATLGLSGDFDDDGAVTGSDFLFWQRTLGSVVSPLSGADENGDSVVDRSDLSAWFGAYDATATTTAIPEPSANAIAVAAVACLAAWPLNRICLAKRHLSLAGLRLA